jgi:hypothetical protein
VRRSWGGRILEGGGVLFDASVASVDERFAHQAAAAGDLLLLKGHSWTGNYGER